MADVPTRILKVAGTFGSYGEDGATFTPSVSEDGTLSWTNNKGLTNPNPVNVKGPTGDTGSTGPQGPQGDKGDPGVHVGSEAPTDGSNVWICPDDIPDAALPNPYKLTLTGAVEAEYDGSSAVTVTIPESSSGGDEMRHIITFSLEEDVSMTYIDKDSDGNPFELKELLVNIKSVGAESNTTGANFKLAINGTAVIASKILSDVSWAVRNANSFCSHTIKTISDGLVFYSFNFKADDTNVYDENMKLVACRAMSLSNIAPYETITSLVFSSTGAPKLGKGTIIAVWGR